jgi:hypothetical protein
MQPAHTQPTHPPEQCHDTGKPTPVLLADVYFCARLTSTCQPNSASVRACLAQEFVIVQEVHLLPEASLRSAGLWLWAGRLRCRLNTAVGWMPPVALSWSPSLALRHALEWR